MAYLIASGFDGLGICDACVVVSVEMLKDERAAAAKPPAVAAVDPQATDTGTPPTRDE